MGIHDQLGHPEDLTTQMEGVTEPALLTFLRREGLHWLQVEVVVQMKIVQVLTMDEQVKHVVALPAHL